jgi:hypothetical protein
VSLTIDLCRGKLNAVQRFWSLDSQSIGASEPQKDRGLLTGLLTQLPQILNLMQGILPLSFIDTRTACVLAARKYSRPSCI